MTTWTRQYAPAFEERPAVDASRVCLDVSLGQGRLPVTRRVLEGCDAFVLDNVLSNEECKALINQANLVGFRRWETDTVYGTGTEHRSDFREAYTVEMVHEELARLIFSRVGEFCPEVAIFSEEDDRHERDIEGLWTPNGMNQDIMISRYLDGGHFSVHSDGTTVFDLNQRTFYTMLLYLTEPTEGGETILYRGSDAEFVRDEKGRLRGDPKNAIEHVKPIPGRALFFYHRILHEGCPADEKYIIRSDVRYQRDPPICTAPEDLEAYRLYQEAELLAEKGKVNAAMETFDRCFKMSPAVRKLYGC